MSQPQFALAWEEYKRNICNGLSTLQQNGEFVDMTLAADGHFVKVHQIIIALASPYLKELISSAECPHPVVFLNKLSYKTLCSVLEYIYTGEVLVSIDNLNELIEAGRELHIKGLEDMKLHQQLQKPSTYYQTTQSNNMQELDEEICYFEISNPKSDDDRSQLEFQNNIILSQNDDVKHAMDSSSIGESLQYAYEEDEGIIEEEASPDYNMTMASCDFDQKSSITNTVMQYTVSNQGSLQMILNRFVYYLKHSNRNNTRQWRCVDYVTHIKCPAHVITKDDVVLQRISAHTHPFHDKKILKKVNAGAIFSAIQEAVKEGGKRKKPKTDDGHGDSE